MVKISNGMISLCVDEKGAQMRSLCDVASRREYLWQADPTVWGRSAPILFPAVGKVYTDGYLYKGERYDMPKHGFARDAVFSVMEKGEDFVSLAFGTDEKIKKIYPFDFEFKAVFSLNGRTLSFSYEIENKGSENMYFSLGAHPGFNIDFGDRVIFSEKENLTALFYNEADRPNEKASPVILNGEDELEITEDFFADGSLCFPAVLSNGVKLVSADGKEYLSMRFGKVPHLWLWAKPGAPYICIEPWHGADETVPIEDITEKKGVVSLETGKKFVFAIDIEV